MVEARLLRCGWHRRSSQRAFEQVVREPVLDAAEVAVVPVVVGQEPAEACLSA